MEDYLHKLKNGRSDVDIDAQEHYSFMKSIDDDISKLNGESKSISSKLGQVCTYECACVHMHGKVVALFQQQFIRCVLCTVANSRSNYRRTRKLNQVIISEPWEGEEFRSQHTRLIRWAWNQSPISIARWPSPTREI